MVMLAKAAPNRNSCQIKDVSLKMLTKIATVTQMKMMRFKMVTRTSFRTLKMSSANKKMMLKNLRVFCGLQRSRAPGPSTILSSLKKTIGFRKFKGLIL